MKNKIFLALIIGALWFTPLFAEGRQEAESVDSSPDTGERISDAAATDWLVEETKGHITVIDSMGSEITISKPVNSIITLGGAPSCSAIKALQAENMVLASTKFLKLRSDFFPVMGSLPSLGSYESPDFEKMITLNPDLVIAPYWYPPELEEKLTPGITVIRMIFNSTEAVSTLGAVLGKREQADEYVSWIESITDVISQRTAELPETDLRKAFIYYGGDWGVSPPPPYGTYGRDNFLVNGMVREAGGQCISTGIPGDWINVDPEWIIEKNPSLIIREFYVLNETPEMGYEVDDPAAVKKLMADITAMAAFETSDAVRNKNVHIIYGDFIQCYWFIGLNYLAKWFHPELFEDIDPGKIHQEFITRFQRLDYNIDEHGVFVYPEL